MNNKDHKVNNIILTAMALLMLLSLAGRVTAQTTPPTLIATASNAVVSSTPGEGGFPVLNMMVAVTNTGTSAVTNTSITLLSIGNASVAYLVSPSLPVVISSIQPGQTNYFPAQFLVTTALYPPSQYITSGNITVACDGVMTGSIDKRGPIISKNGLPSHFLITWPVLTQTQAVQIATSFCQAIGKPVTAPGTAQFPVLDEYTPGGFLTFRNWQPRWDVVFPGQAEVEVIDATGVVASYSDNQSSSGVNSGNAAPAGTAIPEATAIQLAQTALAATGQTEQLSTTATAQEVQFVSPPTADSHNWVISFGRLSHGVLYANDGATVCLYAETGLVQSISLSYPTSPVSNVSTTIAQQQGQVIAQNQLNSAGIQGLTLGSSELQIIVPNTYWQPSEVDTTPHVAWIVNYTQGSPSNNVFYDVWVDANSGAVIGGDDCQGYNSTTPLAAHVKVKALHPRNAAAKAKVKASHNSKHKGVKVSKKA